MPLLRHFSVNTHKYISIVRSFFFFRQFFFFNLFLSLYLGSSIYGYIVELAYVMCDSMTQTFFECVCVFAHVHFIDLVCRLLFPFHFGNRSCSFRQRQHPFAIHETSLIRHRRNGTCYCIVPITVWVHFE